MNNERLENLILKIMDTARKETKLQEMKSIAHIDNRYFKKEYIWKVSAAILLRILVNIAYKMGKNDFAVFFEGIRDQIIDIAENHFDEFNDCHARK